LSDNSDSNISAQHFANTGKLTFKDDDLQTSSKKRDAILTRLHNRGCHRGGPSTSWIL